MKFEWFILLVFLIGILSVQGKQIEENVFDEADDLEIESAILETPTLKNIQMNFEVKNTTRAPLKPLKPSIIVAYVFAGKLFFKITITGSLGIFLVTSLILGLISALVVYVKRPVPVEGRSNSYQDDPDTQPFFSQDFHRQEEEISLEDSLNVPNEMNPSYERSTPSYKPPSVHNTGIAEIPDEEQIRHDGIGEIPDDEQ
jgi:hypothetical protein